MQGGKAYCRGRLPAFLLVCKLGDRRQVKRWVSRTLVASLCALMFLCTATGCKDSDALKEILWDQLSATVDLDNEDKYYINDDSAQLTSDKLSSTETTEDADNLNKTQNIVVYSSTPNNSKNYKAKQSLWSPNPEYQGIEASSGVAFYRTDDPNATEQELEDEQEPQEEPPAEDEQDEDNGSDGDGEGETPSKNGSAKNQETDDGGGQGAQGEEVEGSDASDPRGNVDDDLTGNYVDAPKVGTIAAHGSAAVLVQMIGGKGALAAADNTLLSGGFATVFADEGASAVKTGWSGDGSEKGSIKTSAIIESGADVVLVESSSELTAAEKAALNKGGVKVMQIRPFTNTTYLKKNAQLIGDMLEGSASLEPGWDSVKRAEDYVDYFDQLIAEVCTNANGSSKKLAGAQVFELKNTTKYSFNPSAKFTLLLDGYDESATYTASIDGWKPVANGVALSTIGWAAGPASFYIQAGGLINNAAAKTSATSTGQVVAWQFRQDSAKASKNMWSYKSGGAMDKSTNLKGTDGWDMCLFTSRFSSDFSQADFSMNSAFGAADFPVLIAATQQIKDGVIANSKDANGIYHPYGVESTFLGYVFGKFTTNGSMVQSTIGVDTSVSTSSNLFESYGQIPESAILVSPCGLVSAWTGEATPESFLEAAWVNDVANPDSRVVGWESKVEEFYETFYRYELSTAELKTITAGAVK